MADYLLDAYFWPYVPFEVDPASRKAFGDQFVTFIGWMDWLCKYQDVGKMWENHTSFLLGELMFFTCCILTFVHAWRTGGRYLYVWLAITIHALNVENLCYWLPDLDQFWQAQGILTFFGARAPLYILFGIYHQFDYWAYVMAQKLRLPWWAEGPCVGLFAVMLDLPYDIMGIKNVWWTWHDTDPNIYDRMYWVPWNSYYFHASFACSLVWILRLSRHYLVDPVYDWKKFGREFSCSLLAGLLAFWLGTIQFAALYHPVHDFYKVHSEISTCLFLSFYALLVWIGDRDNSVRTQGQARQGDKWWFDECGLAIALEYIFYMVLVCVCDPVNVVADGGWRNVFPTGLHQPIGPCDVKQKVQTPTGLVLYKNKYLCVDKYDEKYFDFHCLPNGVPKQIDENPLEWYAICGTEFENRAEYIAIIWGCCILFGSIFYQALSRSGTLPVDKEKVYRVRKDVSGATPKKSDTNVKQGTHIHRVNPQPMVEKGEDKSILLPKKNGGSGVETPKQRPARRNDSSRSQTDASDDQDSSGFVSPTITKKALRSSKNMQTPAPAPPSDEQEWHTVRTARKRNVRRE